MRLFPPTDREKAIFAMQNPRFTWNTVTGGSRGVRDGAAMFHVEHGLPFSKQREALNVDLFHVERGGNS